VENWVYFVAETTDSQARDVNVRKVRIPIWGWTDREKRKDKDSEKQPGEEIIDPLTRGVQGTKGRRREKKNKTRRKRKKKHNREISGREGSRRREVWV